MEVFLLWLDELDDALAMLRSLWPRLLGLGLACVLLLGTGFAFLKLPHLVLPVAALLLGATLIERVRRRWAVGPSGTSPGTSP